MQRAICCRIFTPAARPEYPAASLRDYCCGVLVMAAELHLAEDALALHLLLQYLESLVDIVVTDEYLHAAFLFDRAVDGPDGGRPDESFVREAHPTMNASVVDS